MRALWMILVLAGAFACGGSEAKPTGPVAGQGADEADDQGSGDEAMIPPEKFDEIKRTFDRKQIQISRCFVSGVDAGEIEKSEKGVVTVGTVITTSGKASKVRVVETSFKSATLEKCVKETVEGWQFTTLPRELEYSYQYRLERF